MRYLLYCLLILILQQIELAKNEVTEKNGTFLTGETFLENGHRQKRNTHSHGHRGQRQVDFFETAGENVSDNEFVTKDFKNYGFRDDEKLQNDVRLEHRHYDQAGPNGAINTNPTNGEQNGNHKFELFRINDEDPESDEFSYRQERQVKRFEPADVLRGPDKPEVNKNFINLLRWNKNKEIVADLFPPGFQKNEAFPVNDDVADFAVFMKKAKKRKIKNKNSFSGYSSSKEGRYCTTQESQFTPEYTEDQYLRSSKHANEDIIYQNGAKEEHSQKVKKDTLSSVDDLILLSGEVGSLNQVKSDNIQSIGQSRYPSLDNLIKKVAVNEAESDQTYPSDYGQGEALVGEVVREKTITLPEPLVFNSSHVVASFVYTMIPFRSPLLNLLENDKHSKYIMIKIDPILQPSRRISLSEQQLIENNVEYTLEKNVMRVMEKLIGSDSQPDSTDNNLEGMPRSKQKNKTVINRLFRGADESTSDTIKLDNFAIS